MNTTTPIQTGPQQQLAGLTSAEYHLFVINHFVGQIMDPARSEDIDTGPENPEEFETAEEEREYFESLEQWQDEDLARRGL